MKRFRDRFADLIAYPARFFENLTDGKASLIAGMVLVGAIDLFVPDIPNVIKTLFTGKPADDAAFNMAMAVFIVLALGIVDVVFVGVPLFDIFRYLKKKELVMSAGDSGDSGPAAGQVDNWDSLGHKASAVKVMKIYIMSHFIIIPVNIILYYTLVRGITNESSAILQNLALMIFIAVFIWSSYIISRGINILFRFNPIFRRLTFIIVFSWSFIFSMVFDMQIMNWLMKLFR